MFIPTSKLLLTSKLAAQYSTIIANMASNVDAKSVVEDITTSTTKLDAKQSNNTPSTAASSTTKSEENYFTTNEQHQDDDSELEEEEQQSQSDDESMNNNEDENSDAMSEYSYCISDDGEDDDEQEVYDHTKNKLANKIQHQPVSVTHAGAKRKGKLIVFISMLYCYLSCVLFSWCRM